MIRQVHTSKADSAGGEGEGGGAPSIVGLRGVALHKRRRKNKREQKRKKRILEN